MFKKSTIAALVGLAASVGALTSAQAFTLNGYDGAVTMVISGVDQGTLYSSSCGSASLCDSTSGLAAAGAVDSEDSWGIFRIQAIYALVNGSASGPALWSAGSSGEYLVGTYGGMVDQAALVTTNGFGTTQQTVGTGGFLNLYLTNSLTGFTTAVTNGAASRSGTTVTGVDGVGTTFLTANFSGTANSNFPGDSSTSTYTYTSSAGSANGFLDITGGDYATLFRKNTIADLLQNLVDIGFATQNLQGANAPSNWTVGFSGNVNTSVIPEPGSMALAGLGLVGLAALRRRKQQA